MARAPYHLDSLKTILAASGELRAADLARAAGLKDSTLMAAVKPGLMSGEIVRRAEGNSVFYSLADGVEANPPQSDFNAALWADGDLDLYGAIELDDGGVRIPAENVRQLCRLLHGQGPEE